MNSQSENNVEPDTDRRAEPRREACARCGLWVFGESGRKEKTADVVRRNSSFSGVSIIAKLARPMRVGEPVEAVVGASDGSQTHVAGTVAHCRGMEGDYYEVGIRVKAVGSHWILADDVNDSIGRYEWFAEALQAIETQAPEQPV